MNAQLISIESAKLHLYLLKRWKEIRCFVIAFFFFFFFFPCLYVYARNYAEFFVELMCIVRFYISGSQK